MRSATGTRARRRAKTLTNIRKTAKRLVSEEGLAALTIHRLADELDYTPGALYRYFASKDALLADLQVSVFEGFHQAAVHMRAQVADGLPEDADPLAAALAPVLGLAELHRGMALADPAGFAFLSRCLGEPRRLVVDAELAAVTTALLALLQEGTAIVEAAEGAGALAPGPTAQRTIVLVLAVQGVLPVAKVSNLAPELLDTGALVSELVRSLLVGWGADPAAVKQAATLLGTALGSDWLVRVYERTRGGAS